MVPVKRAAVGSVTSSGSDCYPTSYNGTGKGEKPLLIFTLPLVEVTFLSSTGAKRCSDSTSTIDPRSCMWALRIDLNSPPASCNWPMTVAQLPIYYQTTVRINSRHHGGCGGNGGVPVGKRGGGIHRVGADLHTYYDTEGTAPPDTDSLKPSRTDGSTARSTANTSTHARKQPHVA